ncbi:unnamed protein product [Paramecium sonneborni]|uniref:Uncharacterized protein n=1 Tax=Paramecium sonneborni TaxID=65129 RepID=A0A8S1MS33_9CILI|nr:unnamed protein product [Paramecium sonneborni]
MMDHKQYKTQQLCYDEDQQFLSPNILSSKYSISLKIGKVNILSFQEIISILGYQFSASQSWQYHFEHQNGTSHIKHGQGQYPEVIKRDLIPHPAELSLMLYINIYVQFPIIEIENSSAQGLMQAQVIKSYQVHQVQVKYDCKLQLSYIVNL